LDLELDVAGSKGRYLAVTAKDFAGNESELSVVQFNGPGIDDTGYPVPSSVYFYRINAGPFTRIFKMSLRVQVWIPKRSIQALYRREAERVDRSW
jgi:hypothetical protein